MLKTNCHQMQLSGDTIPSYMQYIESLKEETYNKRKRNAQYFKIFMGVTMLPETPY